MVTGLTFGIRAGNLPQWAVEFNLTASELSAIAATAFWGFPLAVIIGGMVVDALGMKKILVFAFICHLAGIILTVYAGSFGNAFWPLFLSTLLIGIANGTVEATHRQHGEQIRKKAVKAVVWETLVRMPHILLNISPEQRLHSFALI